MKEVIGYKYNKLNSDLLKSQGIKPSEVIGSTIQLCFGKITNKNKISEENPDDIIDKMISQNIGTVKLFDEEKFIADVFFNNPIPENVFIKYYSNNKPIYK